MTNRYLRRHRGEFPDFFFDDEDISVVDSDIPSEEDIEGYKIDIINSVKKRSYPTDSDKKQLVDREAERMLAILRRIGQGPDTFSDNGAILRRRKTALVGLLTKWSGDTHDHISWEEALVDFEMMPQRTDYDGLDFYEHTTVAAALWILDDLKRNQKLQDAYQYLPDDYDEVFDIDIPINFYDPSYDEDLIRSVISVIYNRDRKGTGGSRAVGAYCNADTAMGGKYQTKDRENFDGLYALLDRSRVETAKAHFKEKQMEVLSIYMDCRADLDREMSNTVADGIHQTSILSVNSEVDNTRFRDAVMRLDEIEERRRDIEFHIAEYLSMSPKELRERLGKGSLVRKFKGFTIDDPYEICLGLLALIEDGDDAPWLFQSGYCVMQNAANLLPWHDSPFDEVTDDEWNDPALTFNYNGWLNEQTKEAVDYYHEKYDGRNLSQIIYGLTGSVLPRNMHPFEVDRQGLVDRGIPETLADKIIDHAELLFLSQFQSGAGNLSRHEWGLPAGDEVEDEETSSAAEESADEVDMSRLTADLKRQKDYSFEC